MSRARIDVSVALLVLTVALGGLGLGQDAPPQTFRSAAAAVTVDVTVRDRSRRAITGLGPADFEVLDNGVRQRVTEVSYERLPIDVTVALDVSYSVTGDLLERLRRGVSQLMGDLGRPDRLKLILFNMRVTRSMDFTRDVKSVERSIRGAAAGGGTALLDTVSVALVSASSPDRRQLIVVFTDGSDTSSTTSPSTIIEVAGHARATVTFVVPTTAPTPVITFSSAIPIVIPTPAAPAALPLPLPLSPLLATLAKETGGSVLPVGATADLSAAFRRVLEEFRSAYVLYYTPTGVDRAGYHADRGEGAARECHGAGAPWLLLALNRS